MSARIFKSFALLLVTIPLILAVVDAWTPDEAPPEIAADRPAVRGTLLVSVFGDAAVAETPIRHTSVFVNDPGRYRMEDNDVRGFLDGNYKFGWNQPGQIHFRIGRRKQSDVYGEFELFRVVQRWDPIDLPPLAEVKDVRLDLAVEYRLEHPVSVMLFG